MNQSYTPPFGQKINETLGQTFSEMQERAKQLLANTPLADAEKNMRAVLQQGLTKLDLVTQAEFTLQQQLIDKLRERVDALETRIVELEQRLPR